MNNTEVVFDNIEQRILKEIKEAHYSIFVSVAWFTNKKLFGALLEKAKNNCYVSIIIQLDEINSQCGIDYDQIKIGRSECFKISKDAELLHDKFCVIDFQRVITGSYNWTYKASHNSENILILNDPSVATQYISRFEQQKAKFCQSDIQQKSATLSMPNISACSTQVVQPTTKRCSYCQQEIGYSETYLGYSEAYCQHCGELQKDFQHKKSSIVVICKKCLRKQEDSLIDIVNTNFCTFCGSNQLEWNGKI